MSFWDLVNGRATDLQPIDDPSAVEAYAGSVAGMVGGVALFVGAAAAILTGQFSLGQAGFIAARGLIYADRSADSMRYAGSQLEQDRASVPRQKLDQAIRYYERALALKPRNAEVWLRLAISYATTGNLKSAIEAVDKALSINPENHHYWLQKGTFCLQIGDMRGARDAFERASKICSDDSECWSNLGFVHQKMGEDAAAHACWERVTQLDPDTPSGWINRAELAYAIGNISEGIKSWKKACSLDHSLTPRWAALSRDGELQLAVGKLDAALLQFEEAIRCNPDYPDPWIGKSLCEEKKGNFESALQLIEEALRLNNSNAKAWVRRGDLAYAMGDVQVGLKSWMTAWSINHSCTPPWIASYNAANRAFANGDVDTALRQFAEASTKNPDYLPPLLGRALCARKLGYLENALQLIDEYLERSVSGENGSKSPVGESTHIPFHDSDANAWFTRGNILSDIGRSAEAATSWHKAYSIDPKTRVPWAVAYEDGMELLKAGQVAAANKQLFKATQLYPEFTEAWFRRGVSHRALAQSKEARECFERAIALDPSHSLSLLNLGNIEIEIGNAGKALDYWGRALVSNPQLSQAAINKGAVLADAGELEEAAVFFAVAVQNGHPDAARALVFCRTYQDMDPAVGPESK